ncbi:hypothetical protein [Nocardia noduli]|uniref:hypothetical protein n=1 Tax=Nocardia noduli TaxID=2815722 RepID=UPI001C2498B2|nr:hypothetical protein [Nocardia noduli]
MWTPESMIQHRTETIGLTDLTAVLNAHAEEIGSELRSRGLGQATSTAHKISSPPISPGPRCAAALPPPRARKIGEHAHRSRSIPNPAS